MISAQTRSAFVARENRFTAFRIVPATIFIKIEQLSQREIHRVF
jgi:hypothetical protein